MFQREVAERIVARRRTDAYGRLRRARRLAHARRASLFDVPPSAFTPPPKVTRAWCI